ncbi:MAG: hypothetical protein LBF15_01905 [Candidatus Peribacteria bacterium]|jgi:hypothetical protein|nr:hypothetical protein [Candidatus Peribacteria bacterium]
MIGIVLFSLQESSILLKIIVKSQSSSILPISVSLKFSFKHLELVSELILSFVPVSPTSSVV